MFAVGDAEQQTCFLFSLLYNYLPESPIAAVGPPDLDVGVCHAMQGVLTMDHNRALAQRVLAEVRSVAETAGAGSPASRAEAMVELVINVIASTADSAAYATVLSMGPEGRRTLLAAFDRVGICAHDDPFPTVETVSCVKNTNYRIFTAEGEQMTNRVGGAGFEALRPVGDGGGLFSGSGRSYALVRTLQATIFGSVKLAHVIRVESSAAGDVVLRSTDERVAVKCMSKAAVLNLQRSGAPVNENPLKELGCLAYLTRQMNGAFAGPGVLQGDPRRVVPLVDLLEDDEAYYMVRCCHLLQGKRGILLSLVVFIAQRSFFSVFFSFIFFLIHLFLLYSLNFLLLVYAVHAIIFRNNNTQSKCLNGSCLA